MNCRFGGMQIRDPGSGLAVLKYHYTSMAKILTTKHLQSKIGRLIGRFYPRNLYFHSDLIFGKYDRLRQQTHDSWPYDESSYPDMLSPKDRLSTEGLIKTQAFPPDSLKGITADLYTLARQTQMPALFGSVHPK
jgi:hypothetical protein